MGRRPGTGGSLVKESQLPLDTAEISWIFRASSPRCFASAKASDRRPAVGGERSPPAVARPVALPTMGLLLLCHPRCAEQRNDAMGQTRKSSPVRVMSRSTPRSGGKSGHANIDALGHKDSYDAAGPVHLITSSARASITPGIRQSPTSKILFDDVISKCA